MPRKYFKYSRCNKIYNDLNKKYHIKGLSNLLAIKNMKGKEITENTPGLLPSGDIEFNLKLYKRSEDPTNPDPLASLFGTYDGTEIHVEKLIREGFYGHNASTKGTGRALLDLTACHAADAGLSMTFDAVPDDNSAATDMRLYKFYNNAGFTRRGTETRKILNNGTLHRHQAYKTNTKTLRSKFKSKSKKFTVKR